MSDLRFSFPACVIAGKGEITPRDVGLIRQHMWPEGITSRMQAAMAIALDECCPARCPEWSGFVVEAVAEFVVRRDSRDGSVSGETAGWLLEWVAEGGVVRSRTGLDILLHVLETARYVPDFLSALVLNQVRLALLPEPRGPYARNRVAGGAVTVHDLSFIWRLLRSALDRGRLELSRQEQLVLAAINGLATSEDHHAGWCELMSLAHIGPDIGTAREGSPKSLSTVDGRAA